MRHDVGKALDLLIRRHQFSGALLHAHLQLIAGVAQRLLRLHPRREIVHNAREHAVPGEVHLAHRQRDGKCGPIPPPGADFPPNTDDVRLTCLEIPRDVAVMLLPVGGGHEHIDVLPYDLVGGIPKEALGRRVERLDDSPIVNGDDPVHRGLQNGVRARLTVAEHRLGLLVDNDEIIVLLVQFPFGDMQCLQRDL